MRGCCIILSKPSRRNFKMEFYKMKYKNFIANIQWNEYEQIFNGKILKLNIEFEGDTIYEAEREFRRIVDSHLSS